MKRVKHLSLRIDEKLLRRFENAARYEDRSMNWLLLHLIRSHVEKFEEEHGDELRLRAEREAEEGRRPTSAGM